MEKLNKMVYVSMNQTSHDDLVVVGFYCCHSNCSQATILNALMVDPSDGCYGKQNKTSSEGQYFFQRCKCILAFLSENAFFWSFIEYKSTKLLYL